MTALAVFSLWGWNTALNDLDAADKVIEEANEAIRLLAYNVEFVTIPCIEQFGSQSYFFCR
jgi:hypothetical protein